MVTKAVTPAVHNKQPATSFPPAKEEPKKETTPAKEAEKTTVPPATVTNAATSTGSTSEPEETGAQKFVRLTKDRMPKALKRIEMVGNLSAYDWTDSQRDKIFKDLEEAVKKAKARFQANADDKPAGESEYEI